MATSFNVFNLGNFAALDVIETDSVNENAGLLTNQTFGGPTNPLYNNINTFAPVGTGATTGSRPDAYDFQDSNDQFSINGGGTYVVDAVVFMEATITYIDGTSTQVTVGVVQDGAGNTFMVGSLLQDASQDALEAQPIESVTFGNVVWNDYVLSADRDPGDYAPVIDGTGGDDAMGVGYSDQINDNSQSAQIDNNDNYINAGAGNDIVFAGGGDDTVLGGDGNDAINAGAGSDSVNAGSGDDTIFVSDFDGVDLIDGGDGTDSLVLSPADGRGFFIDMTATDANGDWEVADSQPGAQFVKNVENVETGEGADEIIGDGADNVIRSNGGDDTVDGGAGNDSIFGGTGNDTLGGGDGADLIDGGIGNDVLDGGLDASSDTLSGGDGQDYINGGAGDDSIDGGSGNDTLVGEAGNDLLTGGGGFDTFDYLPGEGHDTIADFNAEISDNLGDENAADNDFIDLSGFYDGLRELRDDFDDDGILNQSNSIANGGDVDYANNSKFQSGDSLTFTGANRDSFTSDSTGVTCFTVGTQILTSTGEVPIEDLRVGDLVMTLDHGPQQIRWIGRSDFTATQIAANPKLSPVRISRGVFGLRRDLLVSRQHGMMIDDDFLARAIHLEKSHSEVDIEKPKGGVSYFHIMFDRHEIIFAEGARSESFYPGPIALKMLGTETRRELLAHFPKLAVADSLEDVADCYGKHARKFAGRRMLENYADAAVCA